ncbi:MAG: MauE/DoxX family redox-associated membrane protein, partial [Rhodothermaceae bacterium]
MKQKYNIYLTRVSKYLLVLILLVSGISKIIDPEFALEVLKAFNLFNESINIFIISILPILEIILAVMLLLNYKIRFTNISTIILFFIFFAISIW